MSAKTNAAADPGSNSPGHGAREAGDAPAHVDHKQYHLQNSVISFEPGLSGTLVKIVRRDGVEYVGPVPEATIEAIKEVAWLHA